MVMMMVAVQGGPRHDTAAGAPHRQPRRIADVYGMDFGSWRCGRMEEKWNSGEWGGLPFDLCRGNNHVRIGSAVAETILRREYWSGTYRLVRIKGKTHSHSN